MLQVTSDYGFYSQSHGYTVSMACNPYEVQEAQRLRYKVFAEEMGARLNPSIFELDQDRFDPWCKHLIVRDRKLGRVVGTYRMLSGFDSRKISGFYSDQEFDLSRLDYLRDQIFEVGRACVHQDYRNGVVISLLWGGLIQYAIRNHFNYLMGCASISLADGGAGAANIYASLEKKAMCPIDYRVFPRSPLSLDGFQLQDNYPIPALIKGYVRLGSYVCGEPTWDPDFNTADILMLLSLNQLSPRYAKKLFR